MIAVANAKGGVGKTSIVANISGIAARVGWRVLAIDLDPQGNLATDLGFAARSDEGVSLAATLRGGGAPNTLRDVRPRLDVWAGGPALSSGISGALIPQGQSSLSAALDSVRADYDLVVLDCPPALGPLVDAGLTAADYLLIPIRADHASLSGLQMISERCRQAQAINPRLTTLGITLFDVSRTATAVLREVVEAIREAFLDSEPTILPAVRRSERAAFETRRAGRLAGELAAAQPSEKAAANLARDYEELAAAVLSTVRSQQTG